MGVDPLTTLRSPNDLARWCAQRLVAGPTSLCSSCCDDGLPLIHFGPRSGSSSKAGSKADDGPKASRQPFGGMQGRVSKPADTCYSWWIGAALHLLGPEYGDMVDADCIRCFTMDCQDRATGGIAKFRGYPADPLHSFLGLCGLSLVGEEGLAPVDVLLCIPKD